VAMEQRTATPPRAPKPRHADWLSSACPGMVKLPASARRKRSLSPVYHSASPVHRAREPGGMHETCPDVASLSARCGGARYSRTVRPGCARRCWTHSPRAG
jgi:hypothetical protein